MDGEKEYLVEYIDDERTDELGRSKFRVKWFGWPKKTWEPIWNVEETEAYDQWVNRVEAFTASNGGDTLNWTQAMRSEWAQEYKLAADKEMASLAENGTWKIVPCATDAPVVGSTWHFCQKISPDMTFNKFKAQACAQGSSQQYGVDYTETNSPTIPWAVIRLIVALCVQHGVDIHSMDAITAFVNTNIDRPVYVEQMEGYDLPDFPRKDFVYL